MLNFIDNTVIEKRKEISKGVGICKSLGALMHFNMTHGLVRT